MHDRSSKLACHVIVVSAFDVFHLARLVFAYRTAGSTAEARDVVGCHTHVLVLHFVGYAVIRQLGWLNDHLYYAVRANAGPQLVSYNGNNHTRGRSTLRLLHAYVSCRQTPFDQRAWCICICNVGSFMFFCN